MKEYECFEVKHDEDVGETMAEYQKNVWRLHTYPNCWHGAEPMSYKHRETSGWVIFNSLLR
jgi:hypothetical protein